MDETMDKALLININWHHAVNDQSKLNQTVKDLDDGNKNTKIQAIEADIIYSSIQKCSVMGHPPLIDGDLTLASFLQQLQNIKFQHQQHSIHTCPILKLDFKSMDALQSSLSDVKEYLSNLPSCLHQRVWINADILPGPGEDANDKVAQQKMQPKFDASEFLNLVSSELPKTVLSIGWTTSLTDIHAEYTNKMVNDMIECAKPYRNVTFPVRASCFRQSCGVLEILYQKDWTVTLWWSYELPKEEIDWIYNTLENSSLRNRTYYDMMGFHAHLNQKQNLEWVEKCHGSS